MKCIHCGSDTKYPVRRKNGGRCGSCRHPFAFEPKTDALSVSDGLFQRVVKDVSGDGALSFTDRQLWYEFNRRLLRKLPHIPKPFGLAMAACFAGGVVGAVLLANPLPFIAGVGGTVASGVVGARVGRKKPGPRYDKVPFQTFRDKYLTRYERIHGAVSGLLPPLTTTAPPASTTAVPPDLTAYSFDRAVVVDSAEIAAMLVANRFHFENNCAILSLNRRFPQSGRFDTILEMLRRNPHLTVFALHDAASDNMALAQRLRRPDWFSESSVRVIDLGLRPNHADALRLVLTRGPKHAPPPEGAAHLTPDEVRWLSDGNVAELAALRPARLMRAVYQGFARASQVGPDGTLVVVDTGPGVWVRDGTADVYAADSFG
jgi:hypothetical protein